MATIKTQRRNESIDAHLYHKNSRGFLHEVGALNHNYVYALIDYHSRQILATDHTPHLLNYLRYGIPDSDIDIYPANVNLIYPGHIVQMRLNFLKELSVRIEKYLCHFQKFPPFLHDMPTKFDSRDVGDLAQRLDVDLDALSRERQLFRDSYQSVAARCDILFEYWVKIGRAHV